MAEHPSPLAHAVFRRLFTGQLFALFGSGLSSLALALLAFDMAGAGAAAVLGTALAIRILAKIPIAPLAGAHADRVPRKYLLAGLDILRAVLVLAYPLLTEIWQIYILIFLLSAAEAVFNPVFQAAIPDILSDEERYTRALALSRIAVELETLLAPLAAGLALLLMPYEALFVATSGLLVISAVFILNSGLRAVPPSRATPDRRQPKMPAMAGLRAYWSQAELRGLLALYLAIAAASSMILVNSVVYVRGFLGLGEEALALALAAAGFGSAGAAAMMPRMVRRFGDLRLMRLAGLSLAPLLLLGALLPGYFSFLLLWLALGFALGSATSPAGRLIARAGDSAQRTGLFAAQYALSHACWLLAYPLAGWSAELSGLTTAFLLTGGLALFGATAAHLQWRHTKSR